MPKLSELFHNHCLYFTSNSLARTIAKIAEEEFKATHLSPPHAYVMMLLFDNVYVTPSILAVKLNLSPSTVTRFIDSLERQEYIVRYSRGKETEIRLTAKGSKLREKISNAWQKLYDRYTKVLGVSDGNELSKDLRLATAKLSNNLRR